MPTSHSRIVLACSGDPETFVAVRWLGERYAAEVVTLTLDLGQGGELTDIRERALAAGAVRAHVIDAREEFVREYIVPALQAGALDEHQGASASALARAVIASRLVDVARMEGASAIAHGARSGQAEDAEHREEPRVNSAVPPSGFDDCAGALSLLDRSLRALDPALTVIAPVQIWQSSAADPLEYARARQISRPGPSNRHLAVDVNVWGRSFAGAALRDPAEGSGDGVYTMTRAAAECPDEPAYVDIEFVDGLPVRANGIELPMLELIESLDIIGGAHGVGRSGAAGNNGARHAALVEEAPAGMLLTTAHRALEAFVTDPDLLDARRAIAPVYARLVLRGRWFSPARQSLDAFVRSIQTRVTGSVRMMLFKGSCQVVGRRSAFATAAQAATTADTLSSFDHATADGLVS